MKANRVIAAFMAAAILLAGCGKSDLNELQKDGGTEKITRVSVILPHQDDGYWSQISAGIDSRMADAENAGIDIRSYLPQINYSIPQMTDILKQQIAARTDVIVVQGNEDTEFVQQLLRAQEAGIRIICMDTDLESLPEHIYIGTDNYEAGKTLGEKLLELVGDEELSATVISGQKGYPNMDSRLKGLEDSFESTGAVVIQDILYDDYDALTFMDQYQSCTSDIVVCIEGTGAQTLARMRDSHDDRFRFIVGFDMTDALKDNVMDGILTQDTFGIGATIVDELIRYRQTGSYSAQTINTAVEWHTEYVEDKE